MRDIWFQPTFHKHAGELCRGVFIHAEGPFYDHQAFRPWRLQALAFKAIRRLYPDYDLWRDFPYEYEFDKLAIDVINGSPLLREWVDDPKPHPAISTRSPSRTSRRGKKSASAPALLSRSRLVNEEVGACSYPAPE